ncbi:uncharacterized protein YALI1_E24700g [Yarrowia lipolytica]|jgi:hypothetical protein|uniref:Uncharacterized protein n=1 Tax=Yarrowia lipolytica TaxID=4952 RepID=A0A1D8NJB2_YARLL|nr:hypothetical protein YALI1_E24700g [Yarrowia lipolytica]
MEADRVRDRARTLTIDGDIMRSGMSFVAGHRSAPLHSRNMASQTSSTHQYRCGMRCMRCGLMFKPDIGTVLNTVYLRKLSKKLASRMYGSRLDLCFVSREQHGLRSLPGAEYGGRYDNWALNGPKIGRLSPHNCHGTILFRRWRLREERE